MFLDRFWSKVNKEGPLPDWRPELGPCWLWTASTCKGYGKFWHGSRPNRRLGEAHRIAYEAMIGPIPDNFDIDHLCRVPCCVNPAHLEPVTRKENLRRGIGVAVRRALKAAITHFPQGHPYAGDNLFIDRGRRHCMTCRRKYQREYAREKRRRNADHSKSWATP
jgi:hypothetical protein